MLLRDIRKGNVPKINQITKIIAHVDPDIILLTGIDYDFYNVTLEAFADLLEAMGAPYPYQFARRPNTGLSTGLDMDGDGKINTARDAQGYGRFAGQAGMAILSRYPIDSDRVQDFSALLWLDLPNAHLPSVDGQPFPSDKALKMQRLSSNAHWVVPVVIAETRLNLMAFHPTPPVYDGPEDRNGLRNGDEIALWSTYLNGGLGMKPDGAPFVILGDANLDPYDGQGRHEAIHALISHPLVQDVQPRSLGAVAAMKNQGGVNETQQSDPALDTVDWKDARGPGNLRVDYVLPSVGLDVTNAGVFWPTPDDPDFALLRADGKDASRHRLVWIDVEIGQK